MKINDLYDELSYELAVLAEESIDPPTVSMDPSRVKALIEETGIKLGNESLIKWMNERYMITGQHPSGEEVMDWLNQ